MIRNNKRSNKFAGTIIGTALIATVLTELSGCSLDIFDAETTDYGVFVNHDDKDSNLVGVDPTDLNTIHATKSKSKNSFKIIDYSAYVDDNGSIVHPKYTDILPNDDTPYGVLLTLNDYDYVNNYKIVKDLKNMFEVKIPTMPVMINIDNLKPTTATISLLDEMFNLLEKNGCYVAISGTDTNLNKLALAYANIGYGARLDEIDKIVVDTADNKYDGVYTMVQNGKGQISEVGGFSHSDLIKNNGFNDPSRFLNDVNYIVESGDTLYDIAQSHNISVDDIVKYNNENDGDIISDFNQISIGQNIILPVLDTSTDLSANKTYVTTTPDSTVVSTSEILKGIDISEFQSVDEQKAFAEDQTKNFVYVRYADCVYDHSDTKYDDSYSSKGFVTMTEENNVPNSIYFLPKILPGMSQDDIANETMKIVNELDSKASEGILMDLPIGIDIETNYYYDNQELYNAYVPLVAKVLKDKGYYPIIYSSDSSARSLYQNAIDTYGTDCDFCKVPVWLAGGDDYNKRIDFANSNYDVAQDLSNLTWYQERNIDVAIRQISSQGRVAGFTTDNGADGNVDIDMMLDTSIIDMTNRGCNLGSGSNYEGKCK